jgi:hypothetical protein
VAVIAACCTTITIVPGCRTAESPRAPKVLAAPVEPTRPVPSLRLAATSALVIYPSVPMNQTASHHVGFINLTSGNESADAIPTAPNLLTRPGPPPN